MASTEDILRQLRNLSDDEGGQEKFKEIFREYLKTSSLNENKQAELMVTLGSNIWKQKNDEESLQVLFKELERHTSDPTRVQNYNFNVDMEKGYYDSPATKKGFVAQGTYPSNNMFFSTGKEGLGKIAEKEEDLIDDQDDVARKQQEELDLKEKVDKAELKAIKEGVVPLATGASASFSPGNAIEEPRSNQSSSKSGDDSKKESKLEKAIENISKKTGNAAGAAATAALEPEVGPAAPMLGNMIGKDVEKKMSFFSKLAIGAVVVIIFLMLLKSSIQFVSDYYIYIGAVGLLLLVLCIATSEPVRRDFVSLEGLLIIITLMLHLWIVYNGFLAGTNAILLATGIYIAIAFAYFFAKGFNRGALVYGLMVSAISVLLLALPPLMQNYLDSTGVIYACISSAIMFLPLWPAFLLVKIRQDDPYGAAAWILKAGVLVIGAIAFFAMLYGLFSLGSVMPQGNSQGSDLSYILSTSSEFFKSKFDVIMGKTQATINQVSNPGEYYRGQIEQNTDSKKPLGVSMDTFKAQDKQVTNETPVVIVGAVTAKSFMSTSIPITPSCVIDRKDAPAAQVEPAQLDVLYGTTKSYWCTFPALKTGTYTVKGSVTFPFETWAYIPYVFVDEERASNIARQGKDIKQVLNIGSAPIATYTTGPVIIGMEGSDHPLIVSPTKDILMQGSQIGVTIDSGWDSSGLINNVNRIELKVPSPFILKNCTRSPTGEPVQDQKEPLYNDYVFEPAQFKKELTWQSITCKLDIPSTKRDEAIKMLSEGDYATRTFVAVVNYDYSVTKTTSVQVK